MALSFSRPDPSSPDSVAKAAFSTGRRGYEQNEVRDFLRMVAAELARLQERERFLDRELRTAQRNAPTQAVALDEEVVTRMLGEEAVRILTTSRDAASQIKIRAEEGASRLLRDAADESQRLREEANIEAARRRQDAAADAESELAMAKQQGREMVNEARTYRERVLSELARRREAARLQIEQLVHGRDRLVQAFERARLAAVDVMAEITPLGEPAEYVNLSPTTGPVPVMVPNKPAPVAEPAAEPSSDDVERDAGDPHAEPTASDQAIDDGAAVDDGSVVVALFAGELDQSPLVPPEAAAAEESTLDGPVDVDQAVVDEAVVSEAVVSEAVSDEIADLDGAVVDEVDVEDLEEDAIDDDDVDADAVDELFARLRAARAESVAQRAGLDAGAPLPRSTAAEGAAGLVAEGDGDATRALSRPEDLSVFAASPEAPPTDVAVDESPFGRRDTALGPLIAAGGRKLKRVLADEQNEVLHSLRGKGKVSVEAMLPVSGAHGERYLASIGDELHRAALAGARSLSADPDDALAARLTAAKVTVSAADALVARVVAPLRDRLARAVTDADGDRDELSALARGIYREWKVQQIDEHVDDVVRIAFGAGALAAVEPGTPVQWVHDPHAAVCADCDDNALSGVIGAGQEFATGQSCVPAHEGCRCMLAIAPR